MKRRLRHQQRTKFYLFLCFLLLSLYLVERSPPFLPHSSPTINTPNEITPIEENVSQTTIDAFSKSYSEDSVIPISRLAPIFESDTLKILIKNYQSRATTNDPSNEDYYTRPRLGDNVWLNIERVLPYKMFVKWFVNTSRVTDRFNAETETSLINNYIQKPEVACAQETIFQLPNDVILTDDKEKRIQLDSKINKWLATNQNTPPEKMCNRFRGLQCSASRRVCECENDRMQFIEYTRTSLESPNIYRDGCYVKVWKSCSHLSLDPNIPSEYSSNHSHPNSMKQFLVRMATPMPKMARCERGSYCVDMILNLRKPICWCSSRQYSKPCFNLNASIPLVKKFYEIRKAFHQMMILEGDLETKCTVDVKLDECLEKIKKLVEDPEKNYQQILQLMKDLLIRRSEGVRFCDFRKGMACDSAKRICIYRTRCGQGKVVEVGAKNRKVCKVANGYPCSTLDLQCIEGAECQDFGGGKHCHCVADRFGELCQFEKRSFFATLLQSRVSGFVGIRFVNLQEIVTHALAPLERLMILEIGKKCNPNLSFYATNIIEYLGNVREVTLDQLDRVLVDTQILVGRDEPICDYRKFLGCDEIKGICEPMLPNVDVYEAQEYGRKRAVISGMPGDVRKITLSLTNNARCADPGNFTNIPAIYQDLIHVQCSAPQVCRSTEKNSETNYASYCSCPVGYQGVKCGEKEITPVLQAVKVKRLDVYELPEPVVFVKGNSTERKQYYRTVH